MNAKILAPIAFGAAINLVHAVPRGHGAVVRTAIGNVALALVLTGVGELNEGLGEAFAVTYVIGSLLINGKPFIEWFDVVIGQGPNSSQSGNGSVTNLPTFKVPTQRGTVNA